MNYSLEIKHPFAGFWIRVIAVLVDILILIIPNLILFYAGDPGVLSFIMGFLYYTIFPSSSMQGTPGKLAVGLKIIDEYGNKISYGRAVGRYFAAFISAIILGIGFLMVGWTKRKQGLHDMMCGTLVVYSSKLPAEPNSSSFLSNGNDLKGQDLSGRDFKNADLRGFDMSNANLSGADLRGANLIGAKLIGAKMVGANLRGANLIDANLVEADMREADLTEAILDGVNFAGANLEGAIGISNPTDK